MTPIEYYHFKIIRTKRQSKCKAANCISFQDELDGKSAIIPPGELCVSVSFGCLRSERNFRICMDCAESTIQHYKNPFDKIMFELKEHEGLRVIETDQPSTSFDYDDVAF